VVSQIPDLGGVLQAQAAGINSFDHSHHEAEFFISLRRIQDGDISNTSEDTFMNLNFAFACFIVVSFAIALGHG